MFCKLINTIQRNVDQISADTLQLINTNKLARKGIEISALQEHEVIRIVITFYIKSLYIQLLTICLFPKVHAHDTLKSINLII